METQTLTQGCSAAWARHGDPEDGEDPGQDLRLLPEASDEDPQGDFTHSTAGSQDKPKPTSTAQKPSKTVLKNKTVLKTTFFKKKNTKPLSC